MAFRKYKGMTRPKSESFKMMRYLVKRKQSLEEKFRVGLSIMVITGTMVIMVTTVNTTMIASTVIMENMTSRIRFILI